MMSKTFYQFYGYDIEVVLGSTVLTTALKKGEWGLCDKLTISRQENSSAFAIVSFIPPEATIDLHAYQSLPIRISFRTPADGWQQVFTGFVDTPSLDFITRKVTLNCTDDRNNRVIKMPASQIKTIGLYNEVIFGAVVDQSDELSKRLQTVVANFDFDRFGKPTLTAWKPKDTPDFTLTSKDIRQNSNPQVTFSSRKTTINTINIKFNYTYQRLHQQAIVFIWPGYQDFLREYWNAGKPSFPQREQIMSVATNSDWQLISPVSAMFTPVWPAGGMGNHIIWQPNQVVQSYAPVLQFWGYERNPDGTLVEKKDPDGGASSYVPIYKKKLDANGNVVTQVVSETVTDTSSTLCRAAQWACARRFAQTVTEEYNFQISAPQSILRYGVIDQATTYTLSAEYDTSVWESSSIVNASIQNLYASKDTNRADAANAMQVAYNKAVHDILEVHRDIQVQFQTRGLRPKIDLPHTVSMTVSDPLSTTSHITTKGKVSTVTHNIDFKLETAYSEITLSLSKSDGAGTTSNFKINVPVQNPSYIGVPQTITLGTHLGKDPETTNGGDKWNGWIANCTLTTYYGQNTNVRRTNFSEEFRADYPAIPDALRNEIKYTSSTALTLAIPNDYLETST